MIAPPGVPAAVFELVITEAGKVAQVRQVSGVGAYRETMMRASLKAWRFQPARRDRATGAVPPAGPSGRVT